jgi:hypothetical protein
MSGYTAPPPDDAALPAAFRDALPPEPLLDQHLAVSIEASMHAALAPRAAPPLVAPVPAVAVPRPVAAPAPVRPAAGGARPDLKRLRSVEDKVERAGDEGGVHRSLFIRGVLQRVFHDNWPHNPDFLSWIEQAKALYRDGGAGKELARTPFMQLPQSRAVDAELRRRGPPTQDGLTWSLLLGIVWGVWYCNDEERQRYRVQIGPLLHRGKEPTLFDSERLAAELDKVGAVRASAGAMGCIWVIDDLDAEHPAVYSHLCLLGRFHHSSFMGGAEIGAGGDWVVQDGVIRVISGSSGHYRPARWRFEKALRFMRQRGAIGASTEVTLFSEGQPLRVPATAFIDKPQAFPEPRYTVFKP